MAGRHAQPIDLLVMQGKTHLTKEQIAARKASEIKFGKDNLVCPSYVKRDPVAYAKWKELVKEYKAAAEAKIDIVRSSDAGILAMYCKTFSEYQTLLAAQQRVTEIHYDCDALDEYIGDQDDFNFKIKKQLRDLFSVSAILSIESAVNQKIGMLLRMEDRLFLNPLAKVKNIPKPAKEEKPASKFGAIRGGARG